MDAIGTIVGGGIIIILLYKFYQFIEGSSTPKRIHSGRASRGVRCRET